jgi:sec-independent protein translocase protein TatA
MDGLAGHWWVILLILFIVLIIWGPGKMPEMGAGMGRAIREFRTAVSGVHDAVLDASQMHTSSPHPPEPPIASAPAPVNPAATVPDDARPH